MMLCKLAFRNIKKSIKDYIIYFATLILGIAIFYVFNAIDGQSAMLTLKDSKKYIIDVMTDVLSIVSVFVAFVLGFLIVYASSFLMKRRKKEFAIYMLLGMGKRKISAVIVIETVLVGIVSLFVGLGVGIIASQGMSVVVAHLFEADMTRFSFTVSSAAILKTLLYFLVMYGIVIAFDIFVVGKERLINLINSGKHSEKNYAKNPVLCVIVFMIACLLLGTAYYNVTAGAENLSNIGDLGVEVAKGIVGTFMAFWSVAGMMIIIAGKRKRFYLRGLNAFSVKELGSRVNSNVFSGGIICLLLFFTICILSVSMAVKNSLNKSLEQNVQADIQIYRYTGNSEEKNDSLISQYLQDNQVEMSKFSDYSEINVYYLDGVDTGTLLRNTKYKTDFLNNLGVIRLSDYNRLAATYGRDSLAVADDEYILVANYSFVVDKYDIALKSGTTMDICGKTYKPSNQKCKKLSIEIESTEANTGVLIVPDTCDVEGFIKANPQYSFGQQNIFTANYADMDEEELDAWDEYLSGKMPASVYESMRVTTKTEIYESSIGLEAIFVFVGSYLGMIFLISAAAILALKELSNAADNKDKYSVLRKIGVDEKLINRSLLGQSALFFGLPLGLAAIHSIFGIQTGIYMLAGFSRVGLTGGILFSAGIILLIYLVYFSVTYSCSKEIIKEGRK